MPPSIEILNTCGQELPNPTCIAQLYRAGMKLNEWVHEARTRAGMTMAQLGEVVGRTKANISAWEKGDHEPSFSQVLRIARSTRCDLALIDDWPGSIDALDKRNELDWRTLALTTAARHGSVAERRVILNFIAQVDDAANEVLAATVTTKSTAVP